MVPVLTAVVLLIILFTNGNPTSHAANGLTRREGTMGEKTKAERARDAAKKAGKAAGAAVGKGYRRAQRTVTQAEAFEAFNEAMEEMTTVVSVQHALIGDLIERVAALEAGRKAVMT
jgi:hypothetical protein